MVLCPDVQGASRGRQEARVEGARGRGGGVGSERPWALLWASDCTWLSWKLLEGSEQGCDGTQLRC